MLPPPGAGEEVGQRAAAGVGVAAGAGAAAAAAHGVPEDGLQTSFACYFCYNSTLDISTWIRMLEMSMSIFSPHQTKH